MTVEWPEQSVSNLFQIATMSVSSNAVKKVELLTLLWRYDLRILITQLK